MLPSFIDKEKIPHKPGIYMYKKGGDIIYVGKAIDLHNRVSSYFNNSHNNPKTTHLVSNIEEIETIIVGSELEALILEANLIKKYLPPYNIRLTDDKDYLYIVVTKEDFPRIVTGRKLDTKTSKKYFGPFPSSRIVKTTLKQLRRVFPWCSNPKGPKNLKGRPCFYYHLRLCPGACVGLVSKQEYNSIINMFVKFLEGQKGGLVDDLTAEMEQYAKSLEYEKAQEVKKKLEGIGYLTQPNRVASYLENPNFLEDERNASVLELQKDLNLPTIPERVEAYDISNFQGHQSTGSMVVLTNGEIDKSQYRKFKIKITGKPNDYAMHQEVMTRRVKHKEWPMPDLFLIDGGRGQVRASAEILQKNNINIPVYGLAKREEWLYPPEGDVVKLPKKSLSLRLLQKIRDESHRFAITYHRKLRQKKFGVS